MEQLRAWLQQIEESLKAEPALWGENHQGASDCSEQLERMEELHKELLSRRCVLGIFNPQTSRGSSDRSDVQK